MAWQVLRTLARLIFDSPIGESDTVTIADSDIVATRKVRVAEDF